MDITSELIMGIFSVAYTKIATHERFRWTEEEESSA
jgi:hypothetical protein